MSEPCISVIIPTYNRADVLPRAIDSVLEQTVEDIEVLVVDDASTDETTSVVESYSDNRVKLFSFDENRGANAARTRGIKAAHGEYLAFLDSDDEWLPVKLEQQLTALESSDANVAYTGIKHVDAKGEVNSISVPEQVGDVRSALLRGNFIGSYSCILVAAATVRNVGMPDATLPCWQDWEWYLRLSEDTEFVVVRSPLVIRHNEGEQISTNLQYKLDCVPLIWDRLQDVATSRAEKNAARAHLYFRTGYSALTNGRYTIARSKFFNAIRTRPKEAKFYIYFLLSSPVYPIVQWSKRRLVRERNNQ